ncbi:MAG: methionyl-tRNA formyltransferase [Acidimicrobiia bacterium]
MRIAYFGTPRDAVPALEALADDHDVAIVVTQPDRRRGRGSDLVPSPVKVAAIERAIPVLTPTKAREVIDDVRAAKVDIGVVVAFGQLLPVDLLEAAPMGFVNVHFSLLPRWRGAAPVERALLAGDPETGVDIMAMEQGLDTGAVYAEARTAITDTDTAGSLHERLVAMGTELLLHTLPTISSTTPTEQKGEAVYADKLNVEEFAIDWSLAAVDIDRLVRAGNPRPGAFTAANGKRLKVWRTTLADGVLAPGMVDANGRVGTGDGVIVLEEVQPEGKARMSGQAWRAGVRGELTFG